MIDSPHSGDRYPADFDPLLPHAQLRLAEDAFVDRLYAGATRHGASLLAATFPRIYIDPNRSLLDIDPQLLDEPWPGVAEPSSKSRLGIGLVWRLLDGRPLYARRLTVPEVRRRIDQCWQPYHEALAALLAEARSEHGARWHLNVHSMPDDSYRQLGLGDRPLADFVLGDRDGTTAGEATMQVLERSLRASGFTVVRNDPFKGVEIVRASGAPALGCHAVQVEVKKSLYMDVDRHEPHAGFERVRRAVDAMVEALALHARRTLQGGEGA